MPRRRKGAQHAGGVSAAFGEPSSGPAESAACQDRQESGTGFDETRKLMNSAANGRGGNSHARSVPGATCDGNEKEVRKWARGSGEKRCGMLLRCGTSAEREERMRNTSCAAGDKAAARELPHARGEGVVRSRRALSFFGTEGRCGVPVGKARCEAAVSGFPAARADAGRTVVRQRCGHVSAELTERRESA